METDEAVAFLEGSAELAEGGADSGLEEEDKPNWRRQRTTSEEKARRTSLQLAKQADRLVKTSLVNSSPREPVKLSQQAADEGSVMELSVGGGDGLDAAWDHYQVPLYPNSFLGDDDEEKLNDEHLMWEAELEESLAVEEPALDACLADVKRLVGALSALLCSNPVFHKTMELQEYIEQVCLTREHLVYVWTAAESAAMSAGPSAAVTSATTQVLQRMNRVLERADRHMCELSSLLTNWSRLAELLLEVERLAAAEAHHLRCCSLATSRCCTVEAETALRQDIKSLSGQVDVGCEELSACRDLSLSVAPSLSTDSQEELNQRLEEAQHCLLTTRQGAADLLQSLPAFCALNQRGLEEVEVEEAVVVPQHRTQLSSGAARPRTRTGASWCRRLCRLSVPYQLALLGVFGVFLWLLGAKDCEYAVANILTFSPYLQHPRGAPQ